ncbi:ZIP family metal transporter [bacterium]|nr:ZIP family metal transporter [bacterium]
MSFLSQFFVYGILAVSLTLISGAIPLLNRWKDDHLHGFVSFSAGVLIAIAFVYMLPETMEHLPADKAGLCILGSFLLLFIIEKFVMLHPCEESHCNYHTVGLTAFFGMLTHTFFDGLILGASLLVPHLAPLVFFGIMAHKIPSSFALGSILRKAGWPSVKIILFLLVFGSVIPAGAFTSHYLLESVQGPGVGIAFALSLGTFLYISTSDFLPEVHRAHNRRFHNLVFFLIGIVVMVALKQVAHH